MGRIRNAILDQQHELEEDLCALRQQLIDKEGEFLNLEINQRMDGIHYKIQGIKKRLDILDRKVLSNSKETKIYSMISIISLMAAIYYKLRSYK